MRRMAVLVPAYKPGECLLELVAALLQQGWGAIIVIDDGGGEAYLPIFDALPEGVDVVRHGLNQGKGRAIKAGINHVFAAHPEIEGFVTADADGQHLPEDIWDVAAAWLEEHEAGRETLLLGSRSFQGDVPWTSRVGNGITRCVYHWFTGQGVWDTQTGLRAFGLGVARRTMKLPGERYELEMQQLLALNAWGVEAVEKRIQTVYLDNNSASHFHFVRDSARIYAQVLRYLMPSLVALWCDFWLFGEWMEMVTNDTDWGDGLIWGVLIGTRLVSAALQYSLMKGSLFFFRERRVKETLWRYAMCVPVHLAVEAGIILLGLNVMGVELAYARYMAYAGAYVLLHGLECRVWRFRR